MGIITAEIFYPPGYSISLSMISTLGASPPPDSVIREPSAVIFDITMMIVGAIILVASFLMHKTFDKKLTISMGLLGLGALGVGVFPAFHVVMHPIVALITFASGGVAAILSAKTTKSPFSYISIILGLITLSFLFLGVVFPHSIVPILGSGGTERWAAYPVMIWLIGYGGYLMSK